jgi:protein-disulfide isomerase
MKDDTLHTSKRKKKKSKKRAAPAVAATAKPAPPPPRPSGGMTNTVLIAAVALAAGGAGGWFLRDAKAKEVVEASPEPAISAAPAASSGASSVCDGWATKVCAELGDESEPCSQMKTASLLLPDAACSAAVADVAATVSKAKSARSVCEQLAQKLCTDLGAETESCKMVTERTPSFPTAQCQQLLSQYDEVLEELQQQEKLKQPLSPALAAKLSEGDAPSFGPRDAKVTVVEFSDFECPYCSVAAELVTALKAKYGDRVRFVFRQFPLEIHDNAQLAAEASLAAHAQGKFWAFHDLVFANQKQGISRDGLEKHAKQAGLDMAKFNKALDDHTYADAVKQDMKLAEEVLVPGTPTILIGTTRVEDPSLEAISAEIDAQLGA